jgi:hypothetical protein
MRSMINELTLEELKNKLAQIDELTVLELLDVTSEELVEFLTDQIVERYDVLLEYFQEDDQDD